MTNHQESTPMSAPHEDHTGPAHPVKDERLAAYAKAMCPGGVRPETARTAAANVRAVIAVADQEQAALIQDREQAIAERDAALARAEATEDDRGCPATAGGCAGLQVGTR